MISWLDHGVVFTVCSRTIALRYGRFSFRSLLDQELLHALLWIEDVLLGIEIFDSSSENLVTLLGQWDDFDLVKPHGFVFTSRTLVSTGYVEPAVLVVLQNIVRPHGTNFIGAHARVPDEPEHVADHAA